MCNCSDLKKHNVCPLVLRERRFLQNVPVWNCVIAQGRGKDSEGTRIAASPFTVMDTYSALWLINAIIVLRLKFNIHRLKHVLEGDVY